jgi:GTP1/Obg family GTP-binding protein
MARGKPWTYEEIAVLGELASQGFSPQQIYESGRLPGRTVDAIRKQLKLCSIVQTKHTAIVQTIEPAPDALSMDEVVKLFSTALKQICALQEVDKLTLERFRIIFQAARDYGPLLKFYEEWETVKADVERLKGLVAQLQAEKKVQE